MQELLSFILLLAIISCGLSIMLSPLTGKKMDPFLLLRPIGRYAKRLSRRSLTGFFKTLKQWTRSTWRAAQHPGRPFVAKAAVLRTRHTLWRRCSTPSNPRRHCRHRQEVAATCQPLALYLSRDAGRNSFFTIPIPRSCVKNSASLLLLHRFPLFLTPVRVRYDTVRTAN